MQTITDKLWNQIYEKEKSIYLFLKEKQQTRKLGAINPRGQLFIRRYNKHIFRKLDAYWFNFHLMKALSPDMEVIVKEEDWKTLKTTVLDILQKWDTKQFVSEWFELQVFLPRKDFIS